MSYTKTPELESGAWIANDSKHGVCFYFENHVCQVVDRLGRLVESFFTRPATVSGVLISKGYEVPSAWRELCLS